MSTQLTERSKRKLQCEFYCEEAEGRGSNPKSRDLLRPYGARNDGYIISYAFTHNRKFS